jgi:hypothetical protein
MAQRLRSFRLNEALLTNPATIWSQSSAPCRLKKE